MAAKDFKFISPGVFVNEIDNSQLPATPGATGPAIIGRAQQGPGLEPTVVNSFEEFVQKFGAPVAGNTNDDISRNGNTLGPTYGAYAAQAWLRNNSPITFVRLVGREHENATSAGLAGWKTTNTDPTVSDTSAGGAFGLFVLQSGSEDTAFSDGAGGTSTGSLAAIFYVMTGSVALSGTSVSSSAGGLVDISGSGAGGAGGPAAAQTLNKVASNTYIRATAAGEFKAVIGKGTGAETYVETKFNFNPSSPNFIRKVFNTNPTLTNSSITDQTQSASFENYWLGETFEDEISKVVLTGGDAADQYGVIIPLFNNSKSHAVFNRDFSDPKTGYFIAQDMSNQNTGSFDAQNQQKLFRLVGRNTGRWASRNIKISIRDIKASPDDTNKYGTFTVLIRAMGDTDNRPKILEQFNNCNLNPSSENYIARKIGNQYLVWDDENRKYTSYGDYANKSDYIYVDMVEAVDEAKTRPELLPFGVFGPPKLKNFVDDEAPTVMDLVTGGFNFYNGERLLSADASKGKLISGTLDEAPITFRFPELRLRVSASEGDPTDPRNVYFGVDTTFNRNGRSSKTIGDYTGPKPEDVALYTYETATTSIQTSASFVFTLDDMMNTSTALTGTNVYVSGSRQAANKSTTYTDKTYINSTSYEQVLDNGANQFTTVMHGGFDGMDIMEAEPFRNTLLSDGTERTNYAYNSVKVAIDSLRDPEVADFNLLAMPGLTNNVLNRNLVDVCEDRGDAMAVIDLQGGYVPSTENTAAATARLGSVASTVNNMKNDLQINSSFGAAYYPWVQIQDTINNALVWAPPSVAALGAMSYGQRTQELWFAPAGFTRGGLSLGAAGIPVLNVRERLTSKDRDKLYDANVNPIAQFPAEGIVIFGQKTLQVTPSALDRINVRRLLIFLKRQISTIAATLLFDQNVETTWNRFKGRVGPLLQGVKAGLGLMDYRLILDETTTTPDLIDRNIMYAKIYLKPARSIEFIAIDFVITDSGASFED
jgi:phage tail sheath protein FI